MPRLEHRELQESCVRHRDGHARPERHPGATRRGDRPDCRATIRLALEYHQTIVTRSRAVRTLLAAALCVLTFGCTHDRVQSEVTSMAALVSQLQAADKLVAEGCLDCLLDAYREYDTLRGDVR